MPVSAQEDTRRYNFELIIFKYAQNDYFQSENWDTQWHTPDISSALDLQSPALPSGFRQLSDAEKTLVGSLQALQNASRYKVLAYYAWQQPGLAQKNAQALRIQGGQQHDRLTPLEIGVMLSNTAKTANTSATYHELDGTITIVLGRFLHVYTDLVLLQPVKSVPLESDPNQQRLVLSHENDPQAHLFGFHMQQRRRMRSNELHHLDHPMFGLLIKATPARP